MCVPRRPDLPAKWRSKQPARACTCPNRQQRRPTLPDLGANLLPRSNPLRRLSPSRQARPRPRSGRQRRPLTPEDSAIGGFLETLSADENRAREKRRAEEAELEELDVPAFMRKGGR